MPILSSLITAAILVLGLLLILQVITIEQMLAGMGRLLLAVFALLCTFSVLGMIWRTSILPGLMFIQPILKTGALVGIAVLVLSAIVYIAVRIWNHRA